MVDNYFEYVCTECDITVFAETWDAAELPECWCQQCGSEMELERSDRSAKPAGAE